MKKLLLFIVIFVLFGIVEASKVEASPTNENKAANNPNIVAYYTDGDHAIADEPGETHTGFDLVLMAGKSGNFQQWFVGTTTEEGVDTEGDHTIWKSIDDKMKYNVKEMIVEDANELWGDYLLDGNYSVKTNDFNEK